MAAHAPRVPNLRTNIAFLPKGRVPLADSSYLNRPIVGPTPPKLPARGSNLRHHRVLPAFAGASIDYYKHFPKSSVYTNFLQNFCETLRNFRAAEKRFGNHALQTAFISVFTPLFARSAATPPPTARTRTPPSRAPPTGCPCGCGRTGRRRSSGK